MSFMGEPKRKLTAGGSFFKSKSGGMSSMDDSSALSTTGPRKTMELDGGAPAQSSKHVVRRGSYVEVREAPGGAPQDLSIAFVEDNFTEEENIIYSVGVGASIMDQLIGIFTRLDADGSGSLEVSDFETSSEQGDEENVAVWQWIKKVFSPDQEDSITLLHFVKGWKAALWQEVLEVTVETPWQPGRYNNLLQVIEKLTSSFEEIATAKLDEIVQTLSESLYPTKDQDETRFGKNYRELLDDQDIESLFVLTLKSDVARHLRVLWAAFEKEDGVSLSFSDLEQAVSTDVDTKWAKLSELFDEDGSGTIEFSEFMSGFKQLALAKDIESEQILESGSIEDWLYWMREISNTHITALCNQFMEEGFVGKSGLDRIRYEEEKEALVEGRLVSQILLTDETQEVLTQLWSAMDTENTGTITSALFADDPTSREKWAEMSEFFDEDGDGEISYEEFHEGILEFARRSDDVITFQGATFNDCVRHLETCFNAKVVELCNVFYQKYQ